VTDAAARLPDPESKEELEKPFLGRASNWISMTAAAVAVVGVLGQCTISNIKVERAQLEAVRKQDHADKLVADAEAREREAQAKVREAGPWTTGGRGTIRRASRRVAPMPVTWLSGS